MNPALVISLCVAWQSPLARIDCLGRHEAVLLTEERRTADPVRSDEVLTEYRSLDAAMDRIVRGDLSK